MATTFNSDHRTPVVDPANHRETATVEFKPHSSKPIYSVLAEHQRTEQEWELRELLTWLQTWAERFNSAFTLEVPEVSLCVDWLPRRRLGHFRHGHNGFGLQAEITLNRRHLDRREPWELLGTLLHELLHAWQERHGRPGKNNYHNKQFREQARTLGLVIDTRGHTQYEPDSPFFKLLAEHGVETPAIPPMEYVVRGSSKLKKWRCQCQPPINVRVAVAHFHARCLWCQQLFQQET